MPLTVDPPSEVMLEGGNVTFKCHHIGGHTQEPAVEWNKDDGALPIGRHVVDAKGLLTIYTVEVEDSGKYICNVNTVAGKLTAEARLLVQCE